MTPVMVTNCRPVGVGPGADPGDEERAGGLPTADAATPHDARADDAQRTAHDRSVAHQQSHDGTDHDSKSTRNSHTTSHGRTARHEHDTSRMTSALRFRWPIEADALTLDRFGALDLRIETKPDLTPVTDADKSAEELLRGLLAANRPDDAVLGEEFGGTAVFEGRQWVLDPIDGTKNFVRGVPVWSTLIALLAGRRPDGRRGERTCAGAAVVGRLGRGCVHVVQRRHPAHLGVGRRRRSTRPACRSPT